MKITNVKAMVAKMMTVGLLASAVVMTAPAKAEAQGFRIGVHVGVPVRTGPVYAAPIPYEPVYRPGFYGEGYYGRDYDRHVVIVRHDDHRDWDRDFHRGYYGR